MQMSRFIAKTLSRNEAYGFILTKMAKTVLGLALPG